MPPSFEHEDDLVADLGVSSVERLRRETSTSSVERSAALCLRGESASAAGSVRQAGTLRSTRRLRSGLNPGNGLEPDWALGHRFDDCP